MSKLNSKDKDFTPSLRTFFFRYSVMFSAWFYYVFGISAILFGIVIIFSDKGTWANRSDLTDLEFGLISILVGIVIVGICRAFQFVNEKTKNYTPKANQGNEWDQ